MEDPCLMTPTLERFFFDSKTRETLPILGTSALEQFLEIESERMRMSPDSTMNNHGNLPIKPESLRSEGSTSTENQIPDSTTSECGKFTLANFLPF